MAFTARLVVPQKSRFLYSKNGTFGVATKHPARLILNRQGGAERATLQTERSDSRESFFGYFFLEKSDR